MGTSQECYLRNYLSSEDEDWQRQGLQVLHGQQDCKQQEEEVIRRLGSGKTIVCIDFHNRFQGIGCFGMLHVHRKATLMPLSASRFCRGQGNAWVQNYIVDIFMDFVTSMRLVSCSTQSHPRLNQTNYYLP
jgi:hypothetical protein